MTVQAALTGKKKEKKSAKECVFKVFIPLSEDDVIIYQQVSVILLVLS